jgi:hypothetical protein
MELYATGFNAWNNVRFHNSDHAEPDDIFHFTCVLRDENISGLKSFLSYTVGMLHEYFFFFSIFSYSITNRSGLPMSESP